MFTWEFRLPPPPPTSQPHPFWLFIFFMWGDSLTHPVLSSFLWGVSLTYPLLASFLCGEFLLHIPCWLRFYLGSFSYTSRAGLSFYGGSFSDTSRAGFTFIWGVSLTHPVLALLFCTEFLLHIPYWVFFFFFFFLNEVEFVLQISCLLHFYLRRFS